MRQYKCYQPPRGSTRIVVEFDAVCGEILQSLQEVCS